MFWGATPAELALALAGRFPDHAGGGAAAEALTRSELGDLIRRFPDH